MTGLLQRTRAVLVPSDHGFSIRGVKSRREEGQWPARGRSLRRALRNLSNSPNSLLTAWVPCLPCCIRRFSMS